MANPEPRGTLSAIYKPEWVDPEFGEKMEIGEEQEDIAKWNLILKFGSAQV
jgi:hypothetical protein